MPRLPIPQSARAAGLAVITALLAGACARSGSGTTTIPAGAPAAEETVRVFLDAVHANNLPRLAEIWGTEKGPAKRGMEPEELDKRLSVIKSFLVHDKFEFQPRQTMDALGVQTRVVDVRLYRNGCRPVVPFTLVRWDGKWLVKDIDLSAAGNPVRPCQQSGGPGT